MLVAVLLSNKIQAYLYKAMIPKLYIAHIDDRLPKEVLSDLLALNDMGYGTRIKFEGYYPVYIIMSKPGNMHFGAAVAETHTAPMGCIIRINAEATYEASTIYHELFHCYGYSHVDNIFDVMYYSTTPFTVLETVKPYLKEIKELYE